MEALKEAFRSLSNNKVRTFLSMLGIIIGTIAVITVMALGRGAVQGVTEKISSLGSNVIMITPGYSGGKGGRTAKALGEIFQKYDIENIRNMCPDVKNVTPLLGRSVLVSRGASNTSETLYGADANFANILNLKVQKGRYLSSEDEKNYRNVAVIGTTVAEEVFGSTDPIGKNLYISFGANKIIFTIIGEFEKTGTKLIYNPDKSIMIPLSVAEGRIFQNNGRYSSIIASAKSSQVSNNAIEEIRAVLNMNFNNDESKYRIISQDSILSMVNETTGLLTLLLTAIAGISLLVGGIGIMNIMLVSVSERTKEIGIKMAIGATKARILLEFLIESIVVTLTASIIGTAFSYFIAMLITIMAKKYNIVLSITWYQVLLACGVSTLIGLFFGMYPARKASKLNPVEAVKYE